MEMKRETLEAIYDPNWSAPMDFTTYMYNDKDGPRLGYVTIHDITSGWRAWVHTATDKINKNHIEFTLDYPEDNYAHTPFNMANIIDNFHKILDEIELRMYDGSIK